MLGISFPELLTVAVLAIVIIGPKELPNLVRNIIKLTLKVKRFIKDFAILDTAKQTRDEAIKVKTKLQEHQKSALSRGPATKHTTGGPQVREGCRQ